MHQNFMFIRLRCEQCMYRQIKTEKKCALPVGMTPPGPISASPDPSSLPNSSSVTLRRKTMGVWMSSAWPQKRQKMIHTHPYPGGSRGGIEIVIGLLGYRCQSHQPGGSGEGRGHADPTGNWVKSTVEKGS